MRAEHPLVGGGLDMPPGKRVGELRTTVRGQVFMWLGAAWLWLPSLS
jgi:hypothetical protein